MMEVSLLLAAVLSSWAGFVCLSLAMSRHWSDATGRLVEHSPYRAWLRPLGFALLALTFVLCWWRDGPSFGSVLWVMLMAGMAWLVALTLAWRPHWLVPPAWRE